MKNKLLLSLIVSLFAVSAWAADVSVTEKFTTVVQTGASGNAGSTWTGDVCGWQNVNARRKSSDQINSARATWITVGYTTDETPEYVPGYIKTTNLEGGIKKVSFKYAQFGAEAATTLKWRVSAIGETTSSDVIERNGDDGGNGGTEAGLSYSHSFNFKGNAQLEIYNASVLKNGNNPASGKARLLVGDITITPYLLYRNKDVTVGLKQRGYANDGAQDFINNTGGEGSITYSSDDTNIATVDEENGVITPVGVGTTTITATWSEGASTTYTLHVVDGIIAENFSKVVQTGQTTGADWHGDLWDWKVANVRRGEADTLGLNPRIQATAMRSNAGSTIISANPIEGGVKNLAFDWRQWGAKGTATKMNIKFYYSTDKDNWGDAVATQEVDAATASTPFEFNEDVTGGAKNAYLKMEYTADAAIVAVMGAMKITPYLLYTTKAATLDTRNGLTFTNNDLINNTTGDAVEYSIAPTGSGATIDAGSGQVTATDETEGVFTVKAKWGDVETTYTLTVLSRTATTASYANAKVVLNLGAEVPANTLTKTDGYDGTIGYVSSNPAVATVTSEGVVSLAGGVGQATITATLPQTDDYKAASASYTIYVRDENARKEAFKGLNQSGVVGTDLNDLNAGDLFAWQAQYQVRRGTNDTIWNTTTKGISIGISTNPSASSILQSKDVVEGGIKHLSFYWKQWANNPDKTLRMSVYAGSTLKKADEHASTATPTYEKYLLGANEVMKSNQQLVIKNESYTGEDFEHGTLATDAARIIIDTIYITPYLLYTDKAHELYVGDTYTNSALINNTGGNDITYSLDNNDEEAEIIDALTGEVRALKAGEVTVKATWNEGAFTTYTLTILSKVVTEASFAENVKRVGLDALAISNPLNYTDGYDGTITYSSSNTAVATVNQETGAVALEKGVGQTTITATLPATDNYEAASASYTIYVRDESNARIEAFTGITGGVPSDGDIHDWGGDLFMWQRQYQVRRSGNDTIHAGAEKHQATSIGVSTSPAAPSILQSKEPVEGGIKYLSFYWAQWGAAGEYTRRIAVYAGETLIGEGEHANGVNGDEFMLGVNNAMKSNKQLIIKNESYKGTIETLADNACRIVLDNIYITPYLLYADKSKRVMRVDAQDKNESLINNTGGDASYESSNTDVATVAADGTVTAKARGKATITASYKWNENEEVSTWYEVEVFPVNCETFSLNATAHTYQTEQYGNSYDNPEPVVEDKCTWYAWLGGVVPSNYEPNVAVIRAPRADEQGPAYLRSGALEGGIASMTFDWNLVDNESNINWDIRVLVNGREVERLGNDDLSMTVLSEFDQITINGINEPGNFVITFENHSTVIGDYPAGKNKARFVIDNVTWTNYSGTKTLNENADNSAWLAANNGQTCTVIIDRSPLGANVWNTICLPFAIRKSADLDDAEVKEMTGVDMVGDVLEIYFSDITGDELEAGKPYLVKPTSNKDISKTYADKVISMIASPVIQDNVTMQGLFSPLNVTANDYNTLFVGSPDGEGNNLFYPHANGQLRGLRAYFKITTSAPLSAPLRRARFVVDQTEVVTGMESVQNTDISIQKIIRDGQMIIIRDGKMYNAQGQIIR